MATNPNYNKVLFGATVLIDLTSDTVAADKMLSGITAHDKSGSVVTGNIPTKSGSDLTSSGATVTVPAGYYASNASLTIDPGSVTANTPTINTSTGLVTGSATITAGYVGAGTESATLQLSVVGATTYNASTSQQEIPADRYLTGKQTILAVTTANIDAANIKDGVTVKVGDTASDVRIKSVIGTFTNSSTVSSGQTAASAGQIRSGYSAWVDGVEVQGTLSNTSVVIGTTTVSGSSATRGTATWNAGYIAAGSIQAATFANTPTNGINYIDISDTTEAPVLISGGKLYINAGICDNLCITTAKLSPDGASADLAADKILSGYSAYDNDSNLIAGNIPTRTSSDVTPGTDATWGSLKEHTYWSISLSDATVTIPYGYYAYNVTSSLDPGEVTNPSLTLNSSTGIVTATVTVTAGYVTDATQTSTLQLTVNTSSDVTVSGDTVSIPVGYYPSAVNKTVSAGSVTQNAPTINSSTGLVTATVTIEAGYVTSDTDSDTLQLPVQAATTYNVSNSDQEIPAGKWLTGKQTIKAVTTSNISASNIKDGVTIKVGDSGDDDRIAGVTGTFTDASTVSSGQTAAAAGQILSGYSAWVDGAEVQGSIQSQSAKTITPTRSSQTAISAGKYAAGAVTVDPIPNNYYLLTEVYPVGSLWATESSSATPLGTLGFGTWTQIAPANASWGNLYDTTWNIQASSVDGIRVFKRIS